MQTSKPSVRHGIILSGGPESVSACRQPPKRRTVYSSLGVPVLESATGCKRWAAQLGGKVSASSHREIWLCASHARYSKRLLDGLKDHSDAENRSLLDVWMSHGDRRHAACRADSSGLRTPRACRSPRWSMSAGAFTPSQFHPEVTHTLQGGKILERFVRGDLRMRSALGCGEHHSRFDCTHSRTSRQRQLIARLSGGVDSSVVGALLLRIGAQLTCVFVRSRLAPRKIEGDQVMQTFAQHMGVRVIRVNADSAFYRTQGRSGSGTQDAKSSDACS